MKTFARLSIFETNSSSCHQIVINNDGDYKISKEISVRLGEYGWDFSVLRCIDDRLSYIVTALKCYFNEDEFNTIYGTLKEKLHKFGVETIREPNPVSYSMDHPDWYIDRIMEILNDDTKLYDFLFNGHSFVVTGNDNGYTSFDAPDNWDMDDELKKEVW